jgi:DNA-binding XRE family transcriptional regulator
VQQDDIPALPCLRFERQTRKPLHISYPENPGTIGEHIRRKRMDMRLLQSEVAKILNVSSDCITFWENNRTQPQVNYFPRIIEFLGFLPFEFDTSTFIGKLKSYRFKNGLSHKRLGKVLHVNATTIRGWESGKRTPLKGILKKLEAMFEVSNES